MLSKCTIAWILAGFILLGGIIWGIYKAVRGGNKDKPSPVGISEKSSDFLEMDPRLNVSMSETTPLAIVLVAG